MPRPVPVNPAKPLSAGEAGRRRSARSLGVLVLVAASVFVVGLVLGLVFVHRHGGGPIQGWDNQVEAWMIGHRGGLIGVSKFVAFVGDAPKLAVIAVVLTALLAVTLRTVRCLIPIVAYLGAELQVFVIREIIHRPRPSTAIYPAPGSVPGVHETSFSYPSGHAVAVTAMLFALLGALALTYRWWWPWALAFVASLFVLDTRLVLGVHWFSDVVFGWILGVAWGIAVAVVARQVEWADLVAWLPSRQPAMGNAEPAPPGMATEDGPAVAAEDGRER